MSDSDEARLAAALSGNPTPSSEEKDTPKDTDVAGDAPSSPSKPQPRSDKEHQLETPWTLYFDKKLAGTVDYKNFEENLQKLGQFNTLEGFWKHFAFMARPDTLPKDYNLFLFRHNYIPAWETFPNGGCWIIKVRKHNGLINRLWEELVFACIGELFEEPHIAGVALSTRAREDVLSIWNRDNTRYPEIRFKIGEKLREILNLDASTQVEYKDFSSSLRDGSTYRNAKPYVYAANNDGQQQQA